MIHGEVIDDNLYSILAFTDNQYSACRTVVISCLLKNYHGCIILNILELMKIPVTEASCSKLALLNQDPDKYVGSTRCYLMSQVVAANTNMKIARSAVLKHK